MTEGYARREAEAQHKVGTRGDVAQRGVACRCAMARYLSVAWRAGQLRSRWGRLNRAQAARAGGLSTAVSNVRWPRAARVDTSPPAPPPAPSPATAPARTLFLFKKTNLILTCHSHHTPKGKPFSIDLLIG